jgi:hypothetical protein
MEPEGSLPHSQEPATCPYPELVHFNTIVKIVPIDVKCVIYNTESLKMSQNWGSKHLGPCYTINVNKVYICQTINIFTVLNLVILL